MSSYDKQIGGKHYQKYVIQPSKFVIENKLLYPEGCAIKYIIRHQDKNGKEDLLKAIHFINHYTLVACLSLVLSTSSTATEDVMLQGFYWDVPVDEQNKNDSNYKKMSDDFENSVDLNSKKFICSTAFNIVSNHVNGFF